MKNTKIKYIGPGNNWKAEYRKENSKMSLSDITHRQAETFRKTKAKAKAFIDS